MVFRSVRTGERGGGGGQETNRVRFLKEIWEFTDGLAFPPAPVSYLFLLHPATLHKFHAVNTSQLVAVDQSQLLCQVSRVELQHPRILRHRLSRPGLSISTWSSTSCNQRTTPRATIMMIMIMGKAIPAPVATKKMTTTTAAAAAAAAARSYIRHITEIF